MTPRQPTATSDRALVLTQLREALQRVSDVRAHIHAALADAEDGILTVAILDRMERRLSFAHAQMTKAKGGLTRAGHVMDRHRERIDPLHARRTA